MSKLVKVAETKEVAPGTGKVVEAEGRSIGLFNVAGTFHAIDNTCTHRGGPLGEGDLAGRGRRLPLARRSIQRQNRRRAGTASPDRGAELSRPGPGG
jgi:hypothetical protein